MSELRKDPVVGRWVIFATEKSRRIGDYQSTRQERGTVAYEPTCPFCAGNEDLSGKEIYRVSIDGFGWDVRCVPNRFPVLMVEGELEKRPDGIYDLMNGIGAHEVIIETPRHDETLSDLPVERLAAVFAAVRERIRDLKRDLRFRYVLAFKNHGKAAGQRMAHSHLQLIALPFVPLRVELEIDGCWRHFEAKDRYLFDDIVHQELAEREHSRVVEETERLVAFCPYAARFPFEIWITPKYHAPRFEDITEEELVQLASLMRRVLKRLNRALEFPPYNFMLHSAPVNLPARLEERAQTYQWHIELIPKVVRVAGFEWGSGCYINPTLPEEAAAFLRELHIDE